MNDTARRDDLANAIGNLRQLLLKLSVDMDHALMGEDYETMVALMNEAAVHAEVLVQLQAEYVELLPEG